MLICYKDNNLIEKPFIIHMIKNYPFVSFHKYSSIIYKTLKKDISLLQHLSDNDVLNFMFDKFLRITYKIIKYRNCFCTSNNPIFELYTTKINKVLSENRQWSYYKDYHSILYELKKIGKGFVPTLDDDHFRFNNMPIFLKTQVVNNIFKVNMFHKLTDNIKNYNELVDKRVLTVFRNLSTCDDIILYIISFLQIQL
jgi:hypothetical protein